MIQNYLKYTLENNSFLKFLNDAKEYSLANLTLYFFEPNDLETKTGEESLCIIE